MMAVWVLGVFYEDGKKWVVLGCVLRVEVIGFVDKLDNNCEGDIKIKDYL